MLRNYLFTKDNGKYWYVEEYENLEQAKKACPNDHEVQLFTVETLRWLYAYDERKYLYEN